MVENIPIVFHIRGEGDERRIDIESSKSEADQTKVSDIKEAVAELINVDVASIELLLDGVKLKDTWVGQNFGLTVLSILLYLSSTLFFKLLYIEWYYYRLFYFRNRRQLKSHDLVFW